METLKRKRKITVKKKKTITVKYVKTYSADKEIMPQRRMFDIPEK